MTPLIILCDAMEYKNFPQTMYEHNFARNSMRPFFYIHRIYSLRLYNRDSFTKNRVTQRNSMEHEP